jgi:hypothetical protein
MPFLIRSSLFLDFGNIEGVRKSSWKKVEGGFIEGLLEYGFGYSITNQYHLKPQSARYPQVPKRRSSQPTHRIRQHQQQPSQTYPHKPL